MLKQFYFFALLSFVHKGIKHNPNLLVHVSTFACRSLV